MDGIFNNGREKKFMAVLESLDLELIFTFSAILPVRKQDYVLLTKGHSPKPQGANN